MITMLGCVGHTPEWNKKPPQLASWTFNSPEVDYKKQ